MQSTKDESRLSTPFKNFVNAETTAGVALLAFAIISIILANSPVSAEFFSIWQTKVGIQIGNWHFEKPISLWINDCLMTFFFLVVGLELKRELVVGELSSLKKALLPVFAAFGGVLIPSLLYLSIAGGGKFESGWAIPTSTDIAFCLAALHLLGKRIPLGLKVFTVAAAIVDDLFGVAILTLFYSHGLHLTYLALSLVPLGLLYLANRMHCRQPLMYILLGALLWTSLMSAGIHASVSGVILALFVPVKPTIDSLQFQNEIERYTEEFVNADKLKEKETLNRKRKSAILAIENAAVNVQSPLQRLESSFHPWVAYLILPIFALSSAGVSFSIVESLPANMTLFLAVAVGLVIGKPVGITLFSLLAVKLGIANLPKHISLKHIAGAAALSGIGFTMSLYISTLAFENQEIIQISRLSILAGSLIAWSVGTIILLWSTESSTAKNKESKPQEQNNPSNILSMEAS